MLKEKQLNEEALEPYTGSFIQLLGLSCVHTIKQRSLANKPLTIDDVSQYWHYYKPRLTKSDSPEARCKDWPENLP